MHKIYTSKVYFTKLVIFKQHSYFISDFIFFFFLLVINMCTREDTHILCLKLSLDTCSRFVTIINALNSTCNVHRLDLLHTDGASLASS